MIATVMPPRVFYGPSISATPGDVKCNELLYLAALLNSLVIDYVLRQRVSSNVTMFYIYQLPVPRLTERDAAFAPIVERAAKLICTTPEYDALAAEVGLGDHTAGATDPAEREQLRAELDAMVAHLYGLTETELVHILATFPLVAQRVKDGVLVEFRRRAPNPDDAQLAALIAAGESDQIEFKIAALWNPKTRAKDGSMAENIVQGVAAYMNSYEGGALLIGIENATNRVVGLAEDYAAANAQKADRDGYELWLRDKLGSALGQDSGVWYTISFHQLEGHDVCRINVRPASRAVYANGDLYVRIGNGKKKLNAQQAAAYVGTRWSVRAKS